VFNSTDSIFSHFTSDIFYGEAQQNVTFHFVCSTLDIFFVNNSRSGQGYKWDDGEGMVDGGFHSNAYFGDKGTGFYRQPS
jgi:hypothetical protein